MSDVMLPSSQPFSIRKETLHDQVSDRIRDLIIEGSLEPGSRIDEASLVEQLGVSRTPFREALRTLAAEGLVVIRPSKGSVVRAFSRADVSDMLSFQAMIERHAGELAVVNATDEEIAALEAIHNKMLGYYAARERMAYYKLNQEFHSRLVALSRNSALIETQANLQARLKRIRFMGHGSPDLWAQAVAEHEEMVRHLRARDGVALGQAMEAHLKNALSRVIDTL